MTEKINFSKDDQRLEEGPEEVVVNPNQFRVDHDLLGHDENVEIAYDATRKMSDRYIRWRTRGGIQLRA